MSLDDKGGTPPARSGDDGASTPGWLGATLSGGPRLEVAWVAEGSPAHRAGLYAGDELVAEDGFRIERGALWDRLCERGPGGELRLTVFRREELRELVVKLGTPPDDAAWLSAVADPSTAQAAAFEAWAGNPLPRAL